MNDPTRMEDVERRAYRYDSQDGLMEFLAGVLFFFIARAVVEPHLSWMPALLVFPMRWILRILKERFTYPRIGYVKLRSEDGAKLGRGMLTYFAVVVLVMALGLLVFGDVTSWALWKRWIPAVMGGLTAGGFFYAAGRSGMLRHRLLAVACIAWGVVCSGVASQSVRVGMQRWAVGVGLICLLAGIATFLRFVRTHPIREPEVANGQS